MAVTPSNACQAWNIFNFKIVVSGVHIDWLADCSLSRDAKYNDVASIMGTRHVESCSRRSDAAKHQVVILVPATNCPYIASKWENRPPEDPEIQKIISFKHKSKAP